MGAPDAPSQRGPTCPGAAANRKNLVEHAFADRAEERLAARNLRKGATRGARDGAAVSMGALGIV